MPMPRDQAFLPTRNGSTSTTSCLTSRAKTSPQDAGQLLVSTTCQRGTDDYYLYIHTLDRPEEIYQHASNPSMRAHSSNTSQTVRQMSPPGTLTAQHPQGPPVFNASNIQCPPNSTQNQLQRTYCTTAHSHCYLPRFIQGPAPR